MIKTTIFLTTALFGAVATGAQVTDTNNFADPTAAEQTMTALPQADAVIAQFSYLELSHDSDGFSLSVTDNTAVFIDLEFPGDLHIRIGF